MEFNVAGKVLSAWLSTSTEKSAFNNAAVGFPGGIISKQVSSLHSNGAVSTLALVNVHGNSSEKVAVRLISLPSDGKTTSTKVWGEVKPTTETEAVPSPVKSNVPVDGGPTNVTVISAVKVSSVISVGVPLSVHESIFEASIADILQGGGMRARFPSAV